MGTSTSAPPKTTPTSASDQYRGIKIAHDDSIGAKEAIATQMVMDELTENKVDNQMQWNKTIPQFLDNSKFENKYKRVDIPKDEDGYVIDFDLEDAKGIAEFFNKYGLVVVRNVISADECKRSEEEVWRRIERVCLIDRKDPHSFEKWPALSKIGILGNDIVLSKQFCENRQNPNIHKAFSIIFGNEKLIGVVGRASAMRPTFIPSKDNDKKLVEKKEWRTISNWLHWDMDPFNGRATTFGWKVKDPLCNVGFDQLRVQGILSLTDCGPKDGGFQCVPGFHPHIRGWANQFKIRYKNKDFLPGSFLIPKDDQMHKDVQTCPMRKGSLLIWDTRIPHCTFPNTSTQGKEHKLRSTCF